VVFVDTGFLLAVVRPQDEMHNRAAAWLMALEGQRLLVTEYVLVEAFNELRRLETRNLAILLAEEIRSSDEYLFLTATPVLLQAGLDLSAARRDKAWSLTDCISFHVMGEQGIDQALAHDHHLEQAGFDALLRREP